MRQCRRCLKSGLKRPQRWPQEGSSSDQQKHVGIPQRVVGQIANVPVPEQLMEEIDAPARQVIEEILEMTLEPEVDQVAA